MTVREQDSLIGYVARLRAVAVDRRGVPVDVASRAERCVIRALAGEPYDARLARRARSYFWTVVRRAVVRDSRAGDAAARFVLATVVADLESAGRSPERVLDELERGWADKFPAGLLDEYRAARCA